MSFFAAVSRNWRPEHPALLSEGRTLTYADLDALVARARGWLARHELARGDVLALQLPKGETFLGLHLAALSVGVVTLPLNDRYTPEEVRYLLGDSGAVLAIVPDAMAIALGEVGTPVLPSSAVSLDDCAPIPVESAPEGGDLAVLCYTSGTTGRPKGACITHANLEATVAALHDAWQWKRDDVLIHALPLYHVHGLFVAQHGALWAGATAVWMPRFDAAAVLDAIARHRATLFMGVPTHYHRFLQLPADHPSDVGSMRLFTSGSAPLPASDHAAFAARYGHVILERYGMTEVGIVLSNPYDGPRVPGAVGFPLQGVEIRIVDPAGRPTRPRVVGELHVRGPTVFAGYLNRPAQTAEALIDGWMHTGDLAFRDEDGRVHIAGRRTEVVLSGGFNVYPREVEAVLLEHPLVAEVAVFGLPDADLGERPVAAVVADGSVEPSELLAFCATRLAPYKQPRSIRRMPFLPRNAMGKVDKRRLRDAWVALTVRDAHPTEADAIAAWNVAMAAETEGLTLDADLARRGAAEAFLHGRATYLRAERDGAVVGQCMITTEWSDWRCAEVWWLQSVYVHPEHRGRGVYRALHDEVLRRARVAGAAGLRLYVDQRNHAAAEVYRRVGMNGEHYLVFEQMFPTPAGESKAGEA